jgi:hypothetical protein
MMNVDLLDEGARRRGNRRQEETVKLVEMLALKTVNHRFRWKKKRGLWTWWQRREGRIIKATADYITLVQEEDDVTSYTLKTTRFDSDHRLVKAGFQTRSVQEHRKYVKRRTTFPIPIFPQGEEGNEGDKLLKELSKAAKDINEAKEKVDPTGEARSWISEKTFRLMRKKAAARRFGMTEQVKSCGEQLKASLDEDRQRRYDETAKVLERKNSMMEM